MKLKTSSAFMAAMFAVVLLSACEMTGYTQAKTFNERALYSHSSINALVASTTSALDLRVISSADAIYVRDTAVNSRAVLEAAELAFNGGDLTTAEGRMLMVESVLTSLKSYLIAKGVK